MTWTPGSAGRTDGTVMSRPADDIADAAEGAEGTKGAERAEEPAAEPAAASAEPASEPAAGSGSTPDAPARPDLIERFSRAERAIHRVTAILMLTLMATGAILYLPSLSVAVGHRQAIALIHLYSGWALPIPMAAGLFSKAYRADLRRLNRHTPDDRAWLRSKGWKAGRAEQLRLKVGKFNAGQKLNAAFQCGAIIVMVGTGTLMWFGPRLHMIDDSMRQGATFVHDWLALAIAFVVVGHLWFALNDPQARRGMRTGRVPRAWAQREHGEWAAESEETAAPDDERRAGSRPAAR
jgi:formate dehydrogenase subunit gamma